MIGYIVEYAHAKEPEFDIFQVTSHYFLCEADTFVSPQTLDEYEAELDFQPVWVELAAALQINNSRLEQPDPLRWTTRDTFMLEYVKTHLL